MKKKVRLSDFEIKAIKETTMEVFGEGAKVYILGSRADLSKKGGDVDILIKRGYSGPKTHLLSKT